MTAVPIPGLAGTLRSPRAAGDWLDARSGAPHAVAAAIAQWAEDAARTLGPSSSERRLLESLEALAACDLGFICRRAPGVIVAAHDGGVPIVLAAAPWGRDHGSRALLRACIDAGAEWALVFNGTALAIVDARAGAPRRMAVLPVEHLAARARTAALAGALLAAPAAAGALDAAVRASDGASRELQDGLRAGVRQAVDALSGPLPFDAAVAVLFRVLFVLFAEARALVPVWHALYRDHYSLAALAARRLPGESRGVWASLEAGRRLLGDGCRAGSLHVPAFNGRLFRRAGPRRWTRSAAIDSPLDRPASEALAALVRYRPASGGARRVSYAELDVEELGSIYERILDLDPTGGARARKESGSFYTPRPLTEFLVRRTLAPLVSGASSARILALRVVDPAMGSGAFLVAALRYLAGALERARIEEGALHEGDVTEADRQQLRRLVAQRCLYGVDANPTAVMLAKLSLWLATLSPGRPLGFLDHRLKCGNSLAGIDPAKASSPPAGRRDRPGLPLFDTDAYAAASAAGAEHLARFALSPEDSAGAVRAKEKQFASATAPSSPLGAWRLLCDAWCAWWFMPASARPDAREFRALASALIDRSRVLPKRGVDRRLREAAAVQTRERFFHWPLEFPDVLPTGFDAVIGNPPWEMLRAGAGSTSRSGLKAFMRDAGVYALSTSGHVNLYQVFLERALQLTRAGGRLGLVLPWGLMADEGSAPLRRRLLDGTSIDTLARFDNRAGIFHAHRSLRFAALTATSGSPTTAIDITPVASAAALDDLPESGALASGAAITRSALEDLSGPSLRLPDSPGPAALALALRLSRRHRPLGDPGGWGASFGRELNLTDDRPHFSRSPRAMPVLEGKHITPFRVDTASARHHITREAARRALGGCPFDRPRLAYRDVTASTNHQTLIAAIVPAGCATGHSLFCLRNDWDIRTQRALCAILNSGVANFLIRLFVSAHVTTALIAWLPVPGKAAVVDALGRRDPARVPRVELDAIAAALYGVTADELALLSR